MDDLKPGIYWNGDNLDFGFWIKQHSGKVYFSNTPIAGSKWQLSNNQKLQGMKFLCSLEGEPAHV